MVFIEHLRECPYHHTFQIVASVEYQFGVKYTITSMLKWFHHNGFSHKMPKSVPQRFNVEPHLSSVTIMSA
ncbi:helix-turn-helix domain-containing protein [Candidatus Enterovibrio escicola]|uniref:helix-turn-helix domain-containing protein n=1 Tax=Candidatus Enterovibrio escicola TaxID=1927127 RepID=UPI000BE3A0A2